MGILFGLLNKLALLALAVTLSTVIIRVYVMWWRRRPTRGSKPVGAPGRGVLKALDPRASVVVVLAAAAIGWFIPLFGLSLVAFVAVDVVVGLIAARRACS